MDFILNDKSLCGQFNSVSSFFDSLKNNVRCFELINDTEGSKIYKTQNFYKNKVTSNIRLCDLNKYNDDELVYFLIQLDRIVYHAPYWGDDFKQNLNSKYIHGQEDVSCTCIAEAAENNFPLLSFKCDKYTDKKLDVCKDNEKMEMTSL